MGKQQDNNDEGMDKYAVCEDHPAQQEKRAGAGCPACGTSLQKHGSVVICPNCGTEPFERNWG